MTATAPPTAPADLIALLGQRQPLYALLDAARSRKIREYLDKSEVEYQSLLEGPDVVAMADYVPYLAAVTPGSRLLATLLHHGWGASWGVFLTTEVDFPTLRKHLRHFLSVLLPDKQQAFFRFYDPRVLRVFLPACQEAEAAEFFGPITAFLMEGEDPAELLVFTPGAPRPQQETVSVTVPELTDYTTVLPG